MEAADQFPKTRRNRFHARCEARVAKLLGYWRDSVTQLIGSEIYSGEVGCILPREPPSNVGIDVAYTRCPIVRRVRAEFAEPTWRAFWLTAVEGQSAAEVSAAMGLSSASVYQAKSRVLRRLRERLAEVHE